MVDQRRAVSMRMDDFTLEQALVRLFLSMQLVCVCVFTLDRLSSIAFSALETETRSIAFFCAAIGENHISDVE